MTDIFEIFGCEPVPSEAPKYRGPMGDLELCATPQGPCARATGAHADQIVAWMKQNPGKVIAGLIVAGLAYKAARRAKLI